MLRVLALILTFAAASPALADTPCTPNNPLAPAAGVTCKQDGKAVTPEKPAGVPGVVHKIMQDARFMRADHMIAAHQCAAAKSYAATQRSLTLTQHVDKACLPSEK